MGLKIKMPKYQNRKLSLEEVLDQMLADGLLDQTLREEIFRMKGRSQDHPLTSISGFTLPDRRQPGKNLNMHDLTKWLANFAGLPYVEIDPLKIDIAAVTKVLPKAYVNRIKVLPVAVDEETVTFATAEPFLTEWVYDVERTTRKSVKLVVASPIQISNLLREFYTVHSAIRSLAKRGGLDDTQGTRSGDLEKMLGKSNLAGKDDEGISGIVDWLFQFAYDERATDIHMEPKHGQGVIRFRIDGTLREVYKFDPQVMLPVLSRIKLMADMKIDEKRRPQDGRIKRILSEEHVMEIRASVIPTHYGEKLVLRIFDPKMADKKLEEIGFSDFDLQKWKKVISSSYGLVLVAGPTGSGKSTTLHGGLRYLTKPEVNICTAEDPVEIINDNFNQLQINRDIGLTFAESIRAFMRQDPDIIMVGEIRDLETADMAIQAALTGHMVFSTLHTNDALSTITRLLDLEVPSHLLNATLRGILAQRLVRVLCNHCKEKIPTPEHLWKSLVAPYNVKLPTHVYKPVGCSECKNSGYKGRHIVYEMILLNEKLRKIIIPGTELDTLRQAAEGSYTPIRINGAKKVIDGITNIEEVLRVVI